MSDESYSLKVNDDGSCSIEANNVWGALRGLETFSQTLIRKDSQVLTPYSPLTVNDSARYGHRGILLDSARHFIPLKEIKRVIDTLVINKFNVLHWHMIDAESFPVLTPSEPNMLNPFSPEKYFTMEDLQEINLYARDRGVEVLFELDVPGHAASWAKGKPEIMADCMQKYTNINNYALNPALDETYVTLKNILSDIITSTNSTKIHLGGDEVVYGCWNNDPSIVQFQQENGFNGDQTLGYFVNKADKIANDLGASVIHWEEVFSAGVELPAGSLFQVWTDSSMMSALTSAGHTVIASPSDYWYINLVAIDFKTMYTYDPTNGLTEKESSLIIGGEGTLWAEYIDQDNIEATMYPRAGAIAERLWSPKTVTDTTDATDRMIIQKCRLLNRGFHSAPVKPADYCADIIV